jgi:hypothetical protein
MDPLRSADSDIEPVDPLTLEPPDTTNEPPTPPADAPPTTCNTPPEIPDDVASPPLRDIAPPGDMPSLLCPANMITGAVSIKLLLSHVDINISAAVIPSPDLMNSEPPNLPEPLIKLSWPK